MPRLLRGQIGVAGQNAAVDENMTGLENLEMVGRLYHMGRQATRERANELLEEFDLAEAGDRVVKTYSGGMRRRLDLAGALVARPPVLFLDEPTTGLDPRSRLGLWELIESLVAEGTSVLLTTQYLDEADRLCDRIAVVDLGLVIAEGTPDELKRQVGGERLDIRLCDSNRARSGNRGAGRLRRRAAVRGGRLGPRAASRAPGERLPRPCGCSTTQVSRSTTSRSSRRRWTTCSSSSRGMRPRKDESA